MILFKENAGGTVIDCDLWTLVSDTPFEITLFGDSADGPVAECDMVFHDAPGFGDYVAPFSSAVFITFSE